MEEEEKYFCKDCGKPAVTVFDDKEKPGGRIYYCAAHTLLNEGMTVYKEENLFRRVPRRFRNVE